MRVYYSLTLVRIHVWSVLSFYNSVHSGLCVLMAAVEATFGFNLNQKMEIKTGTARWQRGQERKKHYYQRWNRSERYEVRRRTRGSMMCTYLLAITKTENKDCW